MGQSSTGEMSCYVGLDGGERRRCHLMEFRRFRLGTAWRRRHAGNTYQATRLPLAVLLSKKENHRFDVEFLSG